MLYFAGWWRFRAFNHWCSSFCWSKLYCRRKFSVWSFWASSSNIPYEEDCRRSPVKQLTWYRQNTWWLDCFRHIYSMYITTLFDKLIFWEINKMFWFVDVFIPSPGFCTFWSVIRSSEELFEFWGNTCKDFGNNFIWYNTICFHFQLLSSVPNQ
jgi:hypothetical protein